MLIAPTGLSIDILLSFKITMSLFFIAPALFSPSYASPALKAPSPMTQITFALSLLMSFAILIPKPADTAVELCAVPKGSYSLSFLFTKPYKPSFCLNVSIFFFLPVIIL